jgi:hypothetical protein
VHLKQGENYFRANTYKVSNTFITYMDASQNKDISAIFVTQRLQLYSLKSATKHKFLVTLEIFFYRQTNLYRQKTGKFMRTHTASRCH